MNRTKHILNNIMGMFSYSILICFGIILLSLISPKQVTAATSATIVSTNLLSGVSETAFPITSFVYNLSSLPTGTGATIQFSQDGATWKNSSGTIGGTNTLTTGTNNTISLSTLNWSRNNFYYKIVLTGDGTSTPTLDDITVNYTAYTDCASVPVSGNHSIAAACAFPGTINGVDAGTGTANSAELTLGTGGSLTVLFDQTIAVGSISLTGGTATIIDGGLIKIGTPIYYPDADVDGYPTSVTTTRGFTGGTGWARRSAGIDYNDADAAIKPGMACNGVCSENKTDGTCDFVSAGKNGLSTCHYCNGSSLSEAHMADSSDTYGDCPAIDCDGGATKYYSGWTTNVCYYKLDVSDANAVCDGAGACKTAAVQCAASTQGLTSGVTRTACKTQVGCTGTTIGSLGNVAASSDTYSDCGAIDCDGGATKYYFGWTTNVCYYMLDVSDANAVCDGAGACRTTAVECAASTQGVSTGVTGGACATQTGCTGTTAGSATPLAAGENGLAACNRCNGTSTSVTYIANATTDAEGSNVCTATHYRCNGSGSCTMPSSYCCCGNTSQCGANGGFYNGGCRNCYCGGEGPGDFDYVYCYTYN